MRHRELQRAAVLGAILVACTEPPAPLFVPAAVDLRESSAPVVLAAGDIGSCDPGAATAATARLLDQTPGTILALGDIAYPDGGPAAYRDCYDPWWGRHRARTRPVPGNHDYEFDRASQYFAYFGQAAGTPGRGWYSHRVGEWLVVALNSEADLGAGSAQLRWLERTLATFDGRCALAYFHHPRFSSGRHGDDARLRAAWEILDAAGVDLALSGHDHHYERFPPMDADGLADPDGVRQFVVGTGGSYVVTSAAPGAPSEARSGDTFGVLRLELEPDGYAWEFLSVGDDGFTDAGRADCR